ncbi:MAG: tetratricopeptide repeat protein, partial [bacterium]|nr:tetratricopeptide repeat protein [bacterium]
LKIARNAKIRRWEAVILCNLGNCYSYLGKVEKSIEYLQNSLAIDRELKDRENENISLGNLGMRYATLGNSRKAMDYYNQALKIAREIGSKRGEAFIYFSIGNLLTDKGYLDKACIKFQKAIRIADDIGLGYIQNDGRLALARNYLFKGDLPLAEATLRDTSHYEEPSGKTTRFLLIGLVALRKKDRQAAKDAFTTARQSANELLEHGEADETYSLLLELGFIFCGLAITRAPSNVSRAIDAFQAARTIYKDAGVTKGPYSEFQIIEDADEKGVLADLKEIIPGLSTGRHSLNGL